VNRGITQNTVDSWKATNSLCGYDIPAALRAFDYSIGFGDGLLVVNVADPAPPEGALSTRADNAFDTGILTMAVAGNFGLFGAGSVRAPGNARKAFAIGAADVTTQALESYSGRGPTLDGRTKPDILGPTNVYAAGKDSDTALRLHDGTSAAAPNAAGLATEIWNYFGRPSEPGLIYAAMIAIGSNGSSYDNDKGAGLVQWKDNSSLTANKISMTSAYYIDYTFDVDSTVSFIDAAIWWPETIGSHDDIDVYLINPSGEFISGGTSAPSVFEKASAGWWPGFETGTWTLRIVPYSTFIGTRDVYWALRIVSW
jgi:hypothetical protein